MSEVVFLAGATGAVGKRLSPLLVKAGFTVHGTTRSSRKASDLHTMGVLPVIVDVFDAESLLRAVTAARPHTVIHQLTDLPYGLDPSLMAEARVRNARIRREGTKTLAAAARAAGARRLIAQSIAWIYAPGVEPHHEGDPLDVREPVSASTQGVLALERLTLNSPPLEGIVLRYGQLFGPGTGSERPPEPAPAVHVDAAASAALLAVTHGKPGIYNIVENETSVSSAKARDQLGWSADSRVPPNGGRS